VGRFLQRFEDNEPAFTIGSRAAGQRDRQCNAKRWNFPPRRRTRSHVDLESSDAVHDMVVDALGEAAVRLSTRLPVAFEDGGRIVSKGREL